jgi:hypothetical protein
VLKQAINMIDTNDEPFVMIWLFFWMNEKVDANDGKMMGFTARLNKPAGPKRFSPLFYEEVIGHPSILQSFPGVAAARKDCEHHEQSAFANSKVVRAFCMWWISR